MANSNKSPFHDLDEDVALRSIVLGTATETGEQFFTALVENMARALNTYGAWVTEYIEETRRLRALAFWLGGQLVTDFEYGIDGTPCEAAIESKRLVHIPENVMTLYPNVALAREMGTVSYMGMPLLDGKEKIIGHMAVLDKRSMPEEPHALAIFQIFASRAAAELQRLRAETELRESKEKLMRLVNGAMDAIIELDYNLKVTQINPAAEKVFNCAASRIVGQYFTRFLSDEGGEKLASLIQELGARPQGRQYLWIPGGLKARSEGGEGFRAEATISRFEMRHEKFYTLILRNVNERIEAEKKIHALTAESEYLREEIKSLHDFGEIIGQSKSLLQVLHLVGQLAATGTTVLILGETGTGKEAIAWAVHAASQRKNKPLIKVNCAAIPAALIESEFFGHEKGAFTGATAKRDGRFLLADGGAIFLDEIGELPLDLQVKLLRVLQEGEFEPVGSSKTKKVDVRVIAATNRDLHKEVQEGRFREDLYYRLNVFPIELPPLRERDDDIVLLATAFANKFAQKMGRSLDPLSEEDILRLKSYNWPGNVRELQNVIERAVITSRDGRLNLDSAFPKPVRDAAVGNVTPPSPTKQILTMQQIEQLERENLILALEATGWRVSGEKGAARLLGINASTLSSRLKALGIMRLGQNA